STHSAPVLHRSTAVTRDVAPREVSPARCHRTAFSIIPRQVTGSLVVVNDDSIVVVVVAATTDLSLDPQPAKSAHPMVKHNQRARTHAYCPIRRDLCESRAADMTRGPG